MTDLDENAVFEQGIYQFEADDLIQGGAGGLDNLPNQQLANRTFFLNELALNDVILVRNSVSQTTSANTFETFAWDTVERDDTDSLPASGSLIAVPNGYNFARLSGVFLFSAQASAGGIIGAGLILNGSTGSNYSTVNGMLRFGVAQFGQGSFITPWIPVSAGHSLGMYVYETGINDSLTPNRNLMQLEFRKK